MRALARKIGQTVNKQGAGGQRNELFDRVFRLSCEAEPRKNSMNCSFIEFLSFSLQPLRCFARIAGAYEYR